MPRWPNPLTITATDARAALDVSKGNVAQAAIALAVHRTQLRQWLVKHAIDPGAFKIASAPRPRIRGPRIRPPGDHGVRRPGYYAKRALAARSRERVVHAELIGSLFVVVTPQQIYLAHSDALARAPKVIA